MVEPSTLEKRKELITGFIQGIDDPIKELPFLVAPEISGNYDVKLGIMLMLANTSDVRETQRDRLHILLFGEPGTAKSMFLDYLKTEWDSCYISCDPSAASLKGDARRGDLGAMIFRQYDGKPVSIDDIELMKGIDTLRDVMEFGKYTITKGGRHEEVSAHCRIIGASNDISAMPAPILSRFDLIYHFENPTIEQSMEIVSRFVSEELNTKKVNDFLHIYFSVISTHQPKIGDGKEINEAFKQYFHSTGRGRTGRWIASVWRIAKAIARIRMKDITSEEIKLALEIKSVSDGELALYT